MKFRNPFQFDHNRIIASVRDNDIADVTKIMRNNGDLNCAVSFLKEDTWKPITKEMLEAILGVVDENKKAGKKTFAMEEKWWKDLSFVISLAEARTDMLDVVVASISDFNGDTAEDHFIASLIKTEKLDSQTKLKYLKKMLSGGYGKIQGSDLFLTQAVEHDFVDGLRLMCDVGFDPHKNNEELLRTAAKLGKKDICLFLTNDRLANIDLAITVERKLDNEKVAAYLEQIKSEMPARDEVAASPQLQSERLRELQATVAEMTAQIEELKGREVTLDKLSLPSPKKATREI